MDELCLIGANLTDLKRVPLQRNLRRLNLHSNLIERIANLNSLSQLTHLDLSSNSIRDIEGLSQLVSLRSLNLSSNLIERVSGLAGLYALVDINLSYNSIVRLDGFTELHGARYRLAHVQLHGNQLSSINDIVYCLSGILSLRILTLSAGRVVADNPVCTSEGYSVKLFASIPSLNTIDGLDRHGRQVSTSDDSFSDLLDARVLQSGPIFVQNNESEIILPTPKIDAALSAFRRMANVEQSDPNLSAVSSSVTIQSEEKGDSRVAMLEDRLKMLEKQLVSMAEKGGKPEVSDGSIVDSQTSARQLRNRSAKRDIDDTEESDSPLSSPRPVSRIPKTARQQTAKPLPSTKKSSAPQHAGASAAFEGGSGDGKGYQSAGSGADRRMREDLRVTYVQLMRELERERECRWKAEQSLKQLTEEVEEMERKMMNDKKSQQMASQMVVRMKEALTAERDARKKAQAEVDALNRKLDEMHTEIEGHEKAVEEAQQLLKTKTESSAKEEQEHLRRNSELELRVQKSNQRAAALNRELELVRAESENVKLQLQQLQKLFTDREQAHQREIEGRHPLYSKEVEDLVAKALAKAEREKLREEHALTDKYNQLEKKYSELENEFRMALRIEFQRYNDLETVFEQTRSERDANRSGIEVAMQQNEKLKTLVEELKSVVLKQKGRITELERSRAEVCEQNKELAMHVDEAKQRMKQFVQLKQALKKTEDTLREKESLVASVLEQKRVWSEELAQHDSALARDKGRLEARVEQQQSELDELRQKLQNTEDSLRIRDITLKSQADETQKLKHLLVEKENELKSVQSEAQQAHREMEMRLQSEEAETDNYKKKVEKYRRQNDELKEMITNLEADVERREQEFALRQRQLNLQSKEVLDMVQKSELQLKEREKDMMKEREAHLATAKAEFDAKLREKDDAFRQQLDAAIVGHRAALVELEATKQAEIDEAKRQTVDVENEMRVLLQEMQQQKQQLESAKWQLSVAVKNFTSLI